MTQTLAVITGAGMVAANRIGEIVSFDAESTGHERAAEIPDFDETPYLRSPKNFLDRNSALAFAACEMAVRASGVELPGNPAQCGICLGSMGGNAESLALFHQRLKEKGPRLAPPFLFPHTYMNTTAGLLSIEYGLGGEHWCFCSGATAGMEAVARAAECVARGRADVMMAGGVEAFSEPLFRAVLNHGRLSPTDAGKETCAPFAAHRNGAILGEGAGLFVLESRAHAQARSAPIAGQICGWATSSSAREAMTSALENSAGGKINAVFAAANGSVRADADEAAAITQIFGPMGVPVVALKGITGETLGASGPLNLAAALTAMKTGLLPPAEHQPDSSIGDIDLVAAPRKAQLQNVLVNARATDGRQWLSMRLIIDDF